jgi:hypothetical protein
MSRVSGDIDIPLFKGVRTTHLEHRIFGPARRVSEGIGRIELVV